MERSSARAEHAVQQLRQVLTGQSQLRFGQRPVALGVFVTDFTRGRINAGLHGNAAAGLGPRLRVALRVGLARQLRRALALQHRQIAGIVQLAGVQHAAVPQRMQVGTTVAELQLEIVAALVVGVAGVHRLVDVADQMHDELQRLQALAVGQAAIAEDGALCLQGLDDAVAVFAVLRCFVVAVVFGDVDVVPAGRAAAQARVLGAQLVSPRRDAGQRGVRFGGQQAVHFGAGGGAEAGVGDFGNNAVALRAPGMCGGGDGQQGRRQGGGEEQGVQGFHAHILAGGDGLESGAFLSA
ncbi:hypothetical protein SMG44B_20771 [Stenotrophomonas maltophilia]